MITAAMLREALREAWAMSEEDKNMILYGRKEGAIMPEGLIEMARAVESEQLKAANVKRMFQDIIIENLQTIVGHPDIREVGLVQNLAALWEKVAQW